MVHGVLHCELGSARWQDRRAASNKSKARHLDSLTLSLQGLYGVAVAQKVLFSSIAALTGPAGSANYAAANAALDAASHDLQAQGAADHKQQSSLTEFH